VSEEPPKRWPLRCPACHCRLEVELPANMVRGKAGLTTCPNGHAVFFRFDGVTVLTLTEPSSKTQDAPTTETRYVQVPCRACGEKVLVRAGTDAPANCPRCGANFETTGRESTSVRVYPDPRSPRSPQPKS